MLVECQNPECSFQVDDSLAHCPRCGVDVPPWRPDVTVPEAAAPPNAGFGQAPLIVVISVSILGGMPFLFLGMLSWLCWSLAGTVKTQAKTAPHVRAAVGLFGGVTLAAAMGLWLIAEQTNMLVWIEMLLVLIALLWLLFRPGLIIAIATTAWFAFQIVGFVQQSQGAPASPEDQRNALAFISFRLLGMYMLWYGMPKRIRADWRWRVI
ncbi:MAG: hypothetical protein NXI04_13600 [Planctomycetaceae bacterium]|nr:hypothetical protein [Planctomycetaceae bacterium]